MVMTVDVLVNLELAEASPALRQLIRELVRRELREVLQEELKEALKEERVTPATMRQVADNISRNIGGGLRIGRDE